MRTADDFNLYYATLDPWRISRARFRDRVLRRCLTRFIRGKSVLELGCGEGHLTQAVFYKARSVTGIDISNVALARAKLLDLPNARFESADLLQTSFEGYDVIAAIECIYYLSVFWRPLSSRIVANLIKLPFGYTLLDWLPERMIYQRLYALRAPNRH